MERYLTRREAGDHLRLNERTIDRMVVVGKLPALKIGRSVRFKLSDLEALASASQPRVGGFR